MTLLELMTEPKKGGLNIRIYRALDDSQLCLGHGHTEGAEVDSFNSSK